MLIAIGIGAVIGLIGTAVYIEYKRDIRSN